MCANVVKFTPLAKKYAEKSFTNTRSENIRLNRIALLFQLKYKLKTNSSQLFSYIRHCKDSEEFFIQKAAGWALREYSKRNGEAVGQFNIRNGFT